MATPMDTGRLNMRHLLTQLQENSGQTDEPSIEYMSFIPETLRSNVLVMTSRALPIPPEVITTVFIGTIRPNYREKMWQEDVAKWKDHLGITQYLEIPMVPIDMPPYEKLNATDAIPKIQAALVQLTMLPPGGRIRLVCLGTGFSVFLYQAITFMLKEWKTVAGEKRTAKRMQFITSGDTGANDLANFCQWLCISGVCEEIEFFNTQLYHPFGYCRPAYGVAT